MAQAEDTELRDLLIDALEKNGSLAKIRALLRANIFLAFEDGYENIKQNVSLDNILKLPEGFLSLSLIHEFLEFCNLKNTLFVYMSESRQGKEYSYEGRKKLAEDLNLKNSDNVKEPLIVTLVRNSLRSNQRKYYEEIMNENLKRRDTSEHNYKEDQNCTYIVHDDSSNTSQSHSDNSSDEKNKLHLRLQLDNSDTDTSSDSTRDRSSSEYIPSKHCIQAEDVSKHKDGNTKDHQEDQEFYQKNKNDLLCLKNPLEGSLPHDNKLNSSDSTSYVEIKAFNPSDQKLLNTTGLPSVEDNTQNNPVCSQSLQNVQYHNLQSLVSQTETPSSATLSSVSSISSKNGIYKNNLSKEGMLLAQGSEHDIEEYSNDFTSSDGSKNAPESKRNNSHRNIDEVSMKLSKNILLTVDDSLSPHQHSVHSSKSSISISDIVDLIDKSQKSPVSNQDNLKENISPKSITDFMFSGNIGKDKSHSDESGDLSESSVQSLSNISLDVHSA